MFYQHPEIKGSIRNLRQYYRESAKMNVFSYDIYLNDKLVLSEDFDFSSQSREQALNSAIAKRSVGIARGNRIRQDELIKHELAAVGNNLYVKWCTDLTEYGKSIGLTGFYSVFEKGRQYCIYNTQNLDKALEKLNEITARNQNDLRRYKQIREEIDF
ncbi:hypothetical protein [Anabaena sp. AL93]|jgi:hypothetical protein|uniref:hypothetical protein n=1 Tax=Anabaena sp. AL93 TaxID=1678133 RepID=UPI00080217BB|nr:hypothetical protein [Anabaena sp. AL93]MCX5982559.1 hypothetical protein [Nostocales cyanobacterium LacPavin_0920_SED1_MAG_38_18]OBQ20042.1 MAG: hypothetical protein AN486_07690 [Anabaena sp. AL93]